MTPEAFFEKFELFAEAPNAVAKMRELVLELAVSGKLVDCGSSRGHPDRPMVGPARCSGLSGDEPAHLPTGWGWRPLGEVAQFINGDRSKNYPSKSYRVQEGVPFINAGHLANGDVALSNMDFITEEHFDLLGGGKVEPGDILYCLRGSLGKCAVVTSISRGAIASSLVIVRPRELVHSQYVYICLVSPLGARCIAQYDNGSAQPNLSAANVRRYMIPIPPLAEQKRIVAKVDELMALCDQLEAQQEERETRHATLARASLACFAAAPTPANLDFLFHRSYTIDPADLRKSILTLAVQGKLVAHDPADAPAEAGLRAAGVDLTRFGLPKIDQRFAVPSSWAWLRFAGVGEQRLGKMLDASKNRGTLKPYLRNTNVQWMRFELADVKQMRIEPKEIEELRLQNGDLLICEGGEPGRCAIWADEGTEMYFQKAIHRVRPCPAVLPEWLALQLQLDCRTAALEDFFTGATIKHLTGRSLSQYPVLVPPLAEQRRIVARVDQLMALVDQLEAQLADSRTRAMELLEAVVAQLTAARDIKPIPRAKPTGDAGESR